MLRFCLVHMSRLINLKLELSSCEIWLVIDVQ